MDWREQYRDKLISADDAAGMVQSGQTVVIGFITSEPRNLIEALGRRRGELRGVTVFGNLATGPAAWYDPEPDDAFFPVTGFLSGFSRPAYRTRRMDFQVVTVWSTTSVTRGDRERRTLEPDVFLGQVSTPDAAGFVSFGEQLWWHRHLVRHAGLSICEVNPNFIRTGGDNYIHISAIDYLVEQAEPLAPPVLAQPVPPEEVDAAQVIGANAASLVEDGDTVQIGVGVIAGAATAYLDTKNDLGVHTEVLPPGLVDLVRQGNVTGKYKPVHTGKVVASGMVLLPDDRPFVDRNPIFELYESAHTNDLRVVAAHDHIVTLNNALAIDLTGQICAEWVDGHLYSGIGGQLDFQMGAMYARHGRALTLLPATARGGTVSRIVPQLEAGQPVTVPRTFADYAVTEHGIAGLQGKSERQRAEALIEIADPAFRDELRAAARRLFWPGE